MEDDHVDRRRVDVQQCMKLSLTNSPIDLIVLIVHAHHEKRDAYRPFVLTLSWPSATALRTARRTPGGSALPAAGGSQKGSKTCSKRPLPTVGSLLDFKQAAIQAKTTGDVPKNPASQLVPTVACRNINIALSRPGGYGGAAAPVPIPNTAVKRPSANGTSS